MLFKKYYLSPFVVVTKKKNILSYKHIASAEEFSLSKEVALEPTIETIAGRIFWKRGNELSEYEMIYNHFEASFQKSKPTVGYIETTSRCPFLCIMCPKSRHALERRKVQMDQILFEKIIDQLKFQDRVTLHLFGDPLMDSNFILRLEALNKKGLKASFSTNIPMFANKRVYQLLNYNIESLVVSVDSLDPNTYSKIRKSSKSSVLSHGYFLEKMESFLEEVEKRADGIERIILRAVNLKMNEKTMGSLMELGRKFSRVEIDIKRFINFPNMDQESLGNISYFPDGKSVFVYQLLGRPTPFKCLKPWKSSELAVQSDGEVLPCCLCYNAPYSLGNLSKNRLEDIYYSESYRQFRKKIFYNEAEQSWICHGCQIYKDRYQLENIGSDYFDFLLPYCFEREKRSNGRTYVAVS